MFGWFKKKPEAVVVEINTPSWRLPNYGCESRTFRVLATTPDDAAKMPGVPLLGSRLIVAYECDSIAFENLAPGVIMALARYKKIALREDIVKT